MEKRCYCGERLYNGRAIGFHYCELIEDPYEEYLNMLDFANGNNNESESEEEEKPPKKKVKNEKD